MSTKEHITETECRNCGSRFNLDAQFYYDNICPSCLKERGEEKRTWPQCPFCNEKKPPEEMERVSVPNRGVAGGSERVMKCSDCRGDGGRP